VLCQSCSKASGPSRTPPRGPQLWLAILTSRQRKVLLLKLVGRITLTTGEPITLLGRRGCGRILGNHSGALDAVSPRTTDAPPADTPAANARHPTDADPYARRRRRCRWNRGRAEAVSETTAAETAAATAVHTNR
jgi:hypothetical protein